MKPFLTYSWQNDGGYPSDQRFLQQAEEVILRRLDDTTLNTRTLERACATSRTQLYRRLKRLTGLSTNLFIRHIRLRAALELMCDPTESITSIAYQVGFSDVTYFSRVFRQVYGMSPTKWRQEGYGNYDA